MEVIEKQTYVFGKQELNMEMGSKKVVTADVLYDRSLGYGFVAENCFSSQNALAIAECNSGFKPVYWCMDEKISLKPTTLM